MNNKIPFARGVWAAMQKLASNPFEPQMSPEANITNSFTNSEFKPKQETFAQAWNPATNQQPIKMTDNAMPNLQVKTSAAKNGDFFYLREALRRGFQKQAITQATKATLPANYADASLEDYAQRAQIMRDQGVIDDTMLAGLQENILRAKQQQAYAQNPGLVSATSQATKLIPNQATAKMSENYRLSAENQMAQLAKTFQMLSAQTMRHAQDTAPAPTAMTSTTATGAAPATTVATAPVTEPIPEIENPWLGLPEDPEGTLRVVGKPPEYRKTEVNQMGNPQNTSPTKATVDQPATIKKQQPEPGLENVLDSLKEQVQDQQETSQPIYDQMNKQKIFPVINNSGTYYSGEQVDLNAPVTRIGPYTKGYTGKIEDVDLTKPFNMQAPITRFAKPKANNYQQSPATNQPMQTVAPFDGQRIAGIDVPVEYVKPFQDRLNAINSRRMASVMPMFSKKQNKTPITPLSSPAGKPLQPGRQQKSSKPLGQF